MSRSLWLRQEKQDTKSVLQSHTTIQKCMKRTQNYVKHDVHSHEIKEKSCTHNAQKDSFFHSQRDFFSFCYQLLYGSSYPFFFLFCNYAFYVFVLQNSMFLHLLQRSEEKRFLTERHTAPHFLYWISELFYLTRDLS